MQFASAAHCFPILIRKKPAEDGKYSFEALQDAKCPALGWNAKLEVEPARITLEPGDTILWHSDGNLQKAALRTSENSRSLSFAGSSKSRSMLTARMRTLRAGLPS